jgi:hypothetical protein
MFLDFFSYNIVNKKNINTYKKFRTKNQTKLQKNLILVNSTTPLHGFWLCIIIDMLNIKSQKKLDLKKISLPKKV